MQRPATLLCALCVAIFVLVGAGILLVERSPEGIELPNAAGLLLPPQASQPIVVVLDTRDDDEGPLGKDGPFYEALTDAGLGTVWVSTSEDRISADLARVLQGLKQLNNFQSSRIGIIAEGSGSSSLWEFITEPPEQLRAAVFINVPGVEGLDFGDARTVAVLSLNVESDGEATESHHLVHEAMAASTVTHQVITYGDVGPSAFDSESPDFDAATASDASARATEWLLVRDGVMNQDPAGADQ